MKDPLGVSPSKGNQGTTRGKEKILLPSVSHSTLIYTSESILCSTICVHSATRHNIHMHPYYLFAAILHLNRPRLSLSDLDSCSIPTEVKRFFLYLMWFPDSLY